MYKLVISDDEGKTTVVPLVRDEVSIGRKEGNTIRLTERNVSRRHAELKRVDGMYVVRDLRSYNGIYLNGRRVEGESNVQPGDKVRIGDYLLSLELEKDAPVEGQAPGERPDPAAAATPQAALPARVVMLTPPTAGAEFSIPASGALLGRSELIEVPISHRSVSREHARIEPVDGGYRIVDLASANGIRINGRTVPEATLSSGDILELGQVLFRFVAPGERYRFDPSEAARYGALAAQHADRKLSPKLLMMGGTAAAVLLGIVALATGGSDQASQEAAAEVGADPAPAEATPEAQATSARQAPPADDALARCREAIVGERYAEAMAHATMALDARPDDPDATACRERAASLHDQEQAYVAGQAALAQDDLEAAYFQFSRLPEDSPFRSRPEVAQAAARLGNSRLSMARERVASEPEEAMRLAAEVLDMGDAPGDLHEQASALQREAREKVAQPSERSRGVKAAGKARQRRAARREAASGTSRRSRTATAAGPSPFQQASACLARGDNACVIRALQGRAHTAQELALLIETYRSVGSTAKALRHMAVYLQRYPAGTRAAAYRKLLERRGR